MNLSRVLFFGALVVALTCVAQLPEPLAEKWSSHFASRFNSYDCPSAIATDSVGDVYVAGFVAVARGYRAVLLKFDGANGNLLWNWESLLPDPPPDDSGIGVTNRRARLTVGPDGNPMALFTHADGLMKFRSSDGTVVWTAETTVSTGQYLPQYVLDYEMAVDAAGDIVTVGSGTEAVAGKFRGSDGQRLWLYKPPGVASSYMRGVQIDSTGSAAVTGAVRVTSSSLEQTYTAKLSGTTGSLLWSAIEPNSNPSSVYGRLLQVDSSDDVIVATITSRLLKYRGTDGAKRWERSLGGSPWDLIADNSNRVFVAGDSEIIHLDANDGSVRWRSSGFSMPIRTILVRGSEVLAMGDNGGKIVLAAVAIENGSIRWSQWHNPIVQESTTLITRALTLMAQRPDGDVVLTGATLSSGNNDIVVRRYGPGPSVSAPRTTWVLRSSAQVQVNAAGNGVPGTVVCEYGTTTAYGHVTSAKAIGSSYVPPGATYLIPLNDLEENTLYHARFVATTARGTSATPDFTFTTGWDANGDGLPDEWELSNWGNTFFRSANTDEDRDGLKTLVEYALGTNPRVPDSAGALPIVIDQDDRLSITLPKRPFVNLRVEVGGDFKIWSPAEVVHEDDTTITARDFVPKKEALARFLRVRAVSQ